MLVMYFLTLKLVVFIVYLPVYVGNVLLHTQVDKQQKLLALKIRSTLPTYTGR
jgi:hypothetical protein